VPDLEAASAAEIETKRRTSAALAAEIRIPVAKANAQGKLPNYLDGQNRNSKQYASDETERERHPFSLH
jgi:hypothetical protein